MIAFLAASLLLAANGDQILGTWALPNGDTKVAIEKCGAQYCGTIAWMKTPRNDEKNEDASLRGRPLVGVRILTGAAFDGKAAWTGAKLYGPGRGITVDAKLALTNDDSLQVKASAGIASRTVVWTRVK